MAFTFYDTTDVGNRAVINDSVAHEIYLDRSSNGVDVNDIVPRYEDITKLRYRHFLLNKDASYPMNEHYVVWDFAKNCVGFQRPTITVKVKFFPCLENAEKFYDKLSNTDKLRHNTVGFDEFDRKLASGSSFSSTDDLVSLMTEAQTCV
eukprot:CAMPEP_0170514700 /NCGR_PEP_ID=MMETSP0209-20121228/1279_1 /TAXON_ID=665100 ORGANISM="Litonotus pictus, Strain P1" /NCGR_SAMPLE_ID=MMETSP0209 /ASSEMBLY_ACC=CAM_ASM_000301 /LENGTH=148 /DNA_ID=CAMNT_0010798897 /DNA_START=128 /DNA_END=574 /DNA_ORIENTATION=+